jgi:uncharacterized BrkB/YihY/UPF0761 family membrane protein
METLKRLMLAIDRWQRRHPIVAVTYAVNKKFGDDQANLYVVGLGWYGFTAIYPLLLVIVTIFGFIGSASLGDGIVSTLHQFPVIGTAFNPGKGQSSLHGSVAGLVVGVLGLLYGAQGVTQTAQLTMAEVWNVPQYKRAGFLPRILRSVAGLVIIGGAFVINALVGAIAAGHGQSFVVRAVLVAAMLVGNIGFYYAAFWILTPGSIEDRRLLPGAIFGGVGFTALTTVGTGLVQHQLKHTSDTYGAFASVIGVVTYLLLLAKLSVFAAELNPVLARRLWPRALPMAPPTTADEEVSRALADEQQSRPDERIGVDFEPNPETEAAQDARRDNGGDGGDRDGGGDGGDSGNGGTGSAGAAGRHRPPKRADLSTAERLRT